MNIFTDSKDYVFEYLVQLGNVHLNLLEGFLIGIAKNKQSWGSIDHVLLPSELDHTHGVHFPGIGNFYYK
jgi:hypothetical protein